MKSTELDSAVGTGPGTNDVFTAYGLPGDLKIGSNTPGPHPSSSDRPVYYDEWRAPAPSGYVVSDHLINEPSPAQPRFKILMMGAGAAGIDFLHHAPKELEHLGVDIVCYDKNPEVGGTWYENRYPGCACDVPSMGYTFPWKQNPDWSTFFASGKEIWQYMKDIVDEEGMMKYIKLNSEVTSATWDEGKSKWVVSLSNKAPSAGGALEWVEECDFLINGTGFLNAWKWPDIKGLDTFGGELYHTANYSPDLDLKGKRVAVIGAGSSGIQVVASLYDQVDHLYTWVRSPTWITAAFGQAYAGKDGQNFEYTKEQQDSFRRDPAMYHRYKKTIESELNTRFRLVLQNTRESDEANAVAYSQMVRKLAPKPELIDAIIPKDFNVACRRPTPGNGYLEALAGPKTTVFTKNIGGITKTGVIDSTTGEEYPVDAIICATGFDTSFRPRFPITGLDPKQTLAEKWVEHPSSYLGIGVDGFPNYFLYSGPYTPVAQGSILSIITMLSGHLMQLIRRMRRQHIRRLSPKPKVVRDFVEHANAFMPRTTWAGPCPSWFKQGRRDGPIVMWPGSRLAYFEALEDPHFEDYDIEYHNNGNRFGFLGTGFVDHEFKGGRDTAWYLDKYSQREEWGGGVALCPEEKDRFKSIPSGYVPK